MGINVMETISLQEMRTEDSPRENLPLLSSSFERQQHFYEYMRTLTNNVSVEVSYRNDRRNNSNTSTW